MKVSIDSEYLSPVSEVKQLGGLYKYNLDYGINKCGSEKPYA